MDKEIKDVKKAEKKKDDVKKKTTVKKSTKKVVEKKTEVKKVKKNEIETKEKENIKDKNDKVTLKKSFDIVIPNSEIEKSIDEIAEKYSSDIKMSGFRKGKVPADLLKSRYKGALSEEALNKIVEEYIFKKIDDEKIKIVSQPSIDKIDHKEGKDLKASFTVEIFPEFDIPDLETIEVEIPEKELKIEKYDEKKQIELVLQSRKRLVNINDRSVEDGDMVSFKVQTKILKTKRMTPKVEEHIEVKKDFNHQIKDIYTELKGKRIGDKFSFTREYPSDYSKKKWAGEKVEHFLEIIRIQNYFTPELNEKTIKELGFKDEEGLKKKLKEEYESYSENQIKEIKNVKRVEKLIESVEFPIPESLVLKEMERMKGDPQTMMTLGNEKVLREKAEESVKFTLIHIELQKKYKIEVSSDDLEAEYKKMADQYQIPVKEIRKFYATADKKEAVKDKIRGEKVAKLLEEKMKIKESK